MNGDPELTDQVKLDRVAERIFYTPRPNEDPPPPTKEDLKRPFKISFRNGQPVFEEVKTGSK